MLPNKATKVQNCTPHSAIGTSPRSERYMVNAALFGNLQLVGCFATHCHPFHSCYSSSTHSAPVIFKLHPFCSCDIQAPPIPLLCYSSSTHSTPVIQAPLLPLLCYSSSTHSAPVIQVKRFLVVSNIQQTLTYSCTFLICTPSKLCCKEQHELHSHNYSRR